jgi:2-polyprenyl-6-methoxyphenol hydroxylase-like FAD-dependent oxidoreductase
MSIEDVFVLSILLSRYYPYEKDGHQEAFYYYFKTRNPHTTKIANESYQQSKMGQWTNPYLVKLRENLMRLVPASVLQNKLRKVNLFNVQPWLDEFKQKTPK